MSDWQKILKDESIATLEKLRDKFGDAIDVEALQPAFDNFQMRITPSALDAIKEVGDPMWQQYVPTVEELVSLSRSLQGEHEDWDDYRAAMVAERRVVVRIRPTHAYGALR